MICYDFLMARSFGESPSSAYGHDVWPLDKVQNAGIRTVPGFVIHISDKLTNTSIRDALELELHRLLEDAVSQWLYVGITSAMREQDIRVVVEWRSRTLLYGLERRFEAWERDASSHPSNDNSFLLERKQFIERFCTQLLGYTLPQLTAIDNRYLSEAGCHRDWQLGRKTIRRIVGKYEELYTTVLGAPFPYQLIDQLELIVRRIINTWHERKVQSETVDDGVDLSICARFDVKFPSSGFLGSGFVFTPVLAEGVQDLPGCYSLGFGLADIDAGTAELKPLSETSDLNKQAMHELQQIKDWLGQYSAEPLRLDFIAAPSGVFVDNIRSVVPSAQTAIHIAAYSCKNDPASCDRAVLAITPEHLEEVLLPNLPAQQRRNLLSLGTGIAGAPGACTGILCTSPSNAKELSRQGQSVVFAAPAPAPELMDAILVSNGLIFAAGGATSHVAVIARSSGKPCVLGIGHLRFASDSGSAIFGSHEVQDGEWVTVDGTSGIVYAGHADIVIPAISHCPDLEEVLLHCDEESSIQVYANVDVVSEAENALMLGAQGVGLCRLEHLLARPNAMDELQRVMSLAWVTSPLSEELTKAKAQVQKWQASQGALAVWDEVSRRVKENPTYRVYLAELSSIQQILVEELSPIFDCFAGMPVTVRLIDPPLSEFLSETTVRLMSENGLVSKNQAGNLVQLAQRSNPMLGLRGIRLCQIAPDFTTIQLRAIFESASLATQKTSQAILAHIMAPFVVDPIEVLWLKHLTVEIANQVLKDCPGEVYYQIGTMIETPRSALLAGELAKVCDFLSVGTNDLTQLTWACSRDHSEVDFLGHYGYLGLNTRPFVELDEKGVGSLVSMTVAQARKASPNTKIGICGEHAAAAQAIQFFHGLGIDYVSCPWSRVPAARLGSGQAAISERL